MAGVIATSFGTILLACKSRIVTELEVDETLVKIASRNPMDVPKYNGDKDVILKTGNFTHSQPVYGGAGRTCIRITRWFDAICRTRNYLDETQVDQSWLTDTDNELGYIAWEEQVALCLCGFTPTDANQNQLVVHEIRLFDGGEPTKDQIGREWGGASIRYEVEYLLLLHGSPIA